MFASHNPIHPPTIDTSNYTQCSFERDGRYFGRVISCFDRKTVWDSSTTVALCCAGSVRRLGLVPTDNISIFDATSAHQCISCCTEAAPVAPGVISLRNQNITARRGLQQVEYLPVSSARRNRAQAAQPMQPVDALTRHRLFIVENMVKQKAKGRIDVTMHVSQKRRSCGYVGNVDATSVPQWTSLWFLRLQSGCDAEVVEHVHWFWTALMLRWNCAVVSPLSLSFLRYWMVMEIYVLLYCVYEKMKVMIEANVFFKIKTGKRTRGHDLMLVTFQRAE